MSQEQLTPELIEKMKGCKTMEELIAIAEAEGIELSEKLLEAVSGGNWDCLVDQLDLTQMCLIP